jgi:hypothetical protein
VISYQIRIPDIRNTATICVDIAQMTVFVPSGHRESHLGWDFDVVVQLPLLIHGGQSTHKRERDAIEARDLSSRASLRS